MHNRFQGNSDQKMIYEGLELVLVTKALSDKQPAKRDAYPANGSEQAEEEGTTCAQLAASCPCLVTTDKLVHPCCRTQAEDVLQGTHESTFQAVATACRCPCFQEREETQISHMICMGQDILGTHC